MGNDSSPLPWDDPGNYPAAVNVAQRENGELLLTCPYPPAVPVQSTAHLFIERASQFGSRVLIGELTEQGEWRTLSYQQALLGARSVAQWLLDQRADSSRPLAILSRSSINHFLLAWGAILARVPYVPVSVSYSTVTGAYPKLRAVLDTVVPGFLYAEDLSQHAAALAAIEFDTDEVELISAMPATGATSMTQLLACQASAEVDASVAAIDHHTVNRYMFTSGSTGMPKGVIYTHGMTCHMLAATAGLSARPEPDEESRVLDWMPWSHVGAGVMRINSVINAGGSIYLDTGSPTAAGFPATIANLKTVKPTAFAGAPLGWAMLADALETDEELAIGFFANVRSMGFGSAAMPVALGRRIEQLTIKYTGRRLPFATSLLSTEVATGLQRWWITEDPEVLGLPVPGCEIKLLPLADKFELRVRAAGVTPGYLHQAEKTAQAFDEEGFFRMGDAVRFADPADPAQGLKFAGRVAEEFKLQSGTWVSAGTLRAQCVAAGSPYIRDVVVCGLNQTHVSLLVWPNIDACSRLAGSIDAENIVANNKVQQAISHGLQAHNLQNPGSSTAIRRFLLLAVPPDVGAFEITDKGYVNQAAVQQRRAAAVASLYQQLPPAGVVTIE